MIFAETPLAGAFLVDVEPHTDERGFFARTWCAREFQTRGLVATVAQCSISLNHLAGTIRGLHYQAAPHEETKLVRVTQGRVFDAMVDLRDDSSTYLRWFGVELSAQNRRALYVPGGVAHGFQTLDDGTEVLYQISEFHRPELARGVRWDDPTFDITWPLGQPTVISERDRTLPAFKL